MSKRAARLAWYVARLRSMPPEELPHRVREQRTRRRLNKRAPAVTGRTEDAEFARILGQWVLEYVADRDECRGYCAAQAALFTSGRIVVFRTELGFDGVPDWHRDPLTASLPPEVPRDVKFMWELHRLHFLVPVAVHAALTDDRDLAHQVASCVRSWIAANPAGQGIAWRSGIELALRSLAMLTVADLCCGVTADAELRREVAQSCRQQLRWVRSLPSLYSSANNHRVAELMGLICGRLLLDERPPPAAASRDLDELSQRLGELFHSDGIGAEQSTRYAAFTIEMAHVAHELHQRCGRAPRPDISSALACAGDALAAFVRANGQLVEIGDDDESTVLLTTVTPAESRVAAVLAAVGSPRRANSAGIRTFPRGGYSICRDSCAGHALTWIVDHGPLGHGHLAAHGHADTLAVWLDVDGRPVLCDPGTYLYNASEDWRTYLRSSISHNTLTLDARSSSESAGSFNWRRDRAVARLRAADWSPDGWRIEGDHDGYVRSHGVRHVRAVEAAGPCEWAITDRLLGGDTGREFPARLTWQFAEQLSVEPSAGGYVASPVGNAGTLILHPPGGWTTMAVKGAEHPLGGWRSPGFGRIVPATQLVVEGRLGVARPAVTRIRLVFGEEASHPHARDRAERRAPEG